MFLPLRGEEGTFSLRYKKKKYNPLRRGVVGSAEFRRERKGETFLCLPGKVGEKKRFLLKGGGKNSAREKKEGRIAWAKCKVGKALSFGEAFTFL